MSLSDSFPDPNFCCSASLTMRIENLIVEGDQGKQKDLQGLSENISKESKDEGWYYLPRSSPVISRRQAKKIKKPPSIESNNGVFQDWPNKNFQKGKEFPVSQALLLDPRCSPAAIKKEKCSAKQRNISCESSESQSSSCEESDLLNSEVSQLEKGIKSCFNKCLMSGELNSRFC